MDLESNIYNVSNDAPCATPFPCSADVLQVRYILLRFVPLELADLILEAAEYWAKQISSMKRDVQVCASSSPSYNADWCYLVTSPIPARSRNGMPIPTKVKKVKFTLKSCDQGWGGSREHRGTYRHSCTWFEASILRPSSVLSKNDLAKLITQPVNPVCFKAMGIEEIPGEGVGKRRWHIQRNVHVSRHQKLHEVVWTNTPMDERTEENHGRGNGHDFVQSLLAGDHIAVMTRALYPGWENHVFSAEVEVFYQAF
ncbi:hypothetical protein BDQ12DRAFT_728725 [Crucibulum laeve]|uniref:Uncharacterized protein n=1 Tax=Crucibulum laeve TaxID=68775 RepID=A0A5C3LHM1_9AGAR|nr:hypothetical protein BDQ12DRAFT_728725 [Crucibulum laeve]